MAYLTAKQKLEVLKEAGDTGFILYDFYVSKGNTPEYEYTDIKSGRALGWLPSKVKRVRLVLENLGYLYVEKKKNVLVVTHLGKDNVKKAKAS